MSLGDHFLVFQADKETLAALIQNNTLLYGSAPRAPLRLRLPPPPPSPFGPAGLRDPLSPADLIFKSVELELSPGTKSGALLLNIDVGILRLPNRPEVLLKSGRLRVGFDFRQGTFFAIRFTKATLEVTAPANVPDFAALADVEVAKFLSGNTEETYKLFDDPPDAFGLAVAISRTRVIDANTAAIMVGGTDESAVTRFLGPGASVAVGVAAGRVRSAFLCRAMLRPDELDPTWNNTMSGPTALEVTRLPGGDCGTGEQSRGRDGVDVKITETWFTFRNGYIEVTGKFKAEGTCWSVDDGNFSQKLFLDFDNVNSQIVPRLEPKEPVRDYDVSVDFLCEALAFELGLIVPIIGSVVLGLGAAIAANIAAEAFNPAIDPTQFTGIPFPAIPGVRWMKLKVDPEGLFSDGTMTVSVLSYTPQPRIWYDIISQASQAVAGRDSVSYAPPMCDARTFQYLEFIQTDQKLLQAGWEWLIEPLQYRWILNGQALPGGEQGDRVFTTTVRTALPPPDGVDVPGFQVSLYYDTGYFPGFLSNRNPSEIRLRARAEDLNYWVNLELQITDAMGRNFYHPEVLKFTGNWVEFGADYREYVGECLNKLGDYMDKKGKQARRPKPGEPQIGLSKYVQLMQEHILAGNPEVAEFVPGLVKAHGLAAVNEAIAKLASKKAIT